MKTANRHRDLSRRRIFLSAHKWRDLVLRRWDSSERQVLGEFALTDLDRADALREQIERDGATVTSARSKLARAHPVLRIEAEMCRRFLAAW